MAPYAAQWLADLGADVIKIEPPVGDSTRRTGPTTEPDMSSLFLGLNRGKRSIVLDLKDEVARASFLQLVDTADVLMHNVRPAKMEKLGLGPTEMLARNPRLIYACLHGFGAAGPYGKQPAYDDIIQGASGLAHLMGLQHGAPRYMPSIIADKTTGLVGAIGILAALAGRARTGRGVALEIPMFESMVAFNLVEHLYGATFEPGLGPPVYPRVLNEHRRPYQTLDGYVCLLPYTNAHWAAFSRLGGVDDLTQDERFRTIETRTRHISDLYQMAAGLIVKKTTAEWLELCAKHDIPCSAVRDFEDLLADEHLAATKFYSALQDPSLGKVLLPGVPIMVNGERPRGAFPPRLGEHTREVLEEAGVAPLVVERIISDQLRNSRNATPVE